MAELGDTLAQRGKTYGDFSDNAFIAQALKDVVRKGVNYNSAPAFVKEGIDMILSKISRTVS